MDRKKEWMNGRLKKRKYCRRNEKETDKRIERKKRKKDRENKRIIGRKQ